MVGTFRPRRMASVALLGALALGLAACGGEYPNSTFNPNSDFNAAIDALWDKLLFWGTLVFIGDREVAVGDVLDCEVVGTDGVDLIAECA